MNQREQQPQPNEQQNSTVRFERTAWLAVSREIEAPPMLALEPLQLSDEHVVDARLDGDSIVLA